MISRARISAARRWTGRKARFFFAGGNGPAPALDIDFGALEGIAAVLAPQFLHEGAGPARVGLELKRGGLAVTEGDGGWGILALLLKRGRASGLVLGTGGSTPSIAPGFNAPAAAAAAAAARKWRRSMVAAAVPGKGVPPVSAGPAPFEVVRELLIYSYTPVLSPLAFARDRPSHCAAPQPVNPHRQHRHHHDQP